MRTGSIPFDHNRRTGTINWWLGVGRAMRYFRSLSETEAATHFIDLSGDLSHDWLAALLAG
jgi:hypothetical protein